MKIALLIIVLISISFSMKARETMPTLVLDQSVQDLSLNLNESVFKFTFMNISENNASETVEYSIDGVVGKMNLTKDNSIELKTTPGKHLFQFYYNSNYLEVFTETILIRPRYRDNYSVYLTDAIYPVISEKPVIYLYPETETNVEVKLNVKGKTTFTYPEYSDGWKFIAQSDGTLKFGAATYNYLFWEGSQRHVLASNNVNKGFIVKGENAISFLEEKLKLAGLTTKEQADFITYWGPRLSQNETNFVHFEFNESCDQFAELDITPNPDNLYRIYMLWHPVNTEFNVIEQKIIPIVRKGFTVVEWGGQELNSYEL